MHETAKCLPNNNNRHDPYGFFTVQRVLSKNINIGVLPAWNNHTLASGDSQALFFFLLQLFLINAGI